MTHDGEPDSYEYASRLATWIWEKHYKNESPHWKPLNDLLGVLTQIDNMTTGLVRAQPEQEPVATLFGSLPVYDVSPKRRKPPTQDLSAPLTVNGVPMYPQREWQGLTVEEIEAAGKESRKSNLLLPYSFARAIEAKLKEKNAL